MNQMDHNCCSYANDGEISNSEYHSDSCGSNSPTSDKNVKNKIFDQNDNNINEIIFGDVFEKEFNKVFNGNNNLIIPNDKDKDIFPAKIKEKTVEKVKSAEDENEHIIINIQEEGNKYFPFTKGVGIQKCLEKIGYDVIFTTPSLISLSFSNAGEKIFNIIKVKKSCETEYTQKEKEKKSRKYKSDDIRKKIKSKFHKCIKNIINKDLKQVGSKKYFDSFPQSFIANITIKLNNIALNYTYEDLIKIDINSQILNQKNQDGTSTDKFNINLGVLKYLKKNQKIYSKSLFSKICNMKYSDILKAYFLSSEFEESIIELHNKGEIISYIEDYINKSLNYVNFFSENKKV